MKITGAVIRVFLCNAISAECLKGARLHLSAPLPLKLTAPTAPSPPTVGMRIALLFVLAFACLSGGCVHQTVIRTVPDGATVSVDGEVVGTSPVVIERPLGLMGEIEVKASHESFEPSERVVNRDEWFIWPALLSIVPFFAAPLVVIPFAGPFIAGGWAVATSPTLLGLLFIRRYPAEVVIELAPRVSIIDNIFLPTDAWTVPDGYAPNPIPPDAKPAPPDPAATPLSQKPANAFDARNPKPEGLNDVEAEPDEDENPLPLLPQTSD